MLSVKTQDVFNALSLFLKAYRLVLIGGVPIILATRKIMFVGNRKPPAIIAGFIEHILTLLGIFTGPVGYGRTNDPQHERICCLFFFFLIASVPEDCALMPISRC